MRRTTRGLERCLLALMLALPLAVAAPRQRLTDSGSAADTAVWRAARTSMFGLRFQTKLVANSASWQIALERWRSCAGNRVGGECFYFRISSKRTGTVSRLLLANLTAQVDAISLVGGAHAAILGRATANLSVVNVVDLQEARVVDHFVCWWPVISPGNRFVAYVKWFPPHVGYQYSLADEYLVYDLRASPEANRTPFSRGKALNPYDVGWPIYPLGATNKPGDNVLVGHNLPAHALVSNGLFWLGQSDTVAFVDRYEWVDSLVLADVSRGLKNPAVTVRALDAARIVDLAACRRVAAPSDYERWSKHPGVLINVKDISACPKRPGCLRLRLYPQPGCLAATVLDVQVGPS